MIKPDRGTFIYRALLELVPNKRWKIINDFTYEDLIWEDESEPPTKEQVELKADELEKLYDDTEYRLYRKNEYPSVEDQLDILYHGGLDAWKNVIMSVKEKYPKP